MMSAVKGRSGSTTAQLCTAARSDAVRVGAARSDAVRSMSDLRIAIAGGRRVRQGLGPFVARDLVAAGAQVVAVLGTSAATAQLAADEIRDRCGARPRAYTDLAALVAATDPDALAILSPSRTHEALLHAALGADVHVLCEKPLLWGDDGFTARADAIVASFRDRNRLLAENCQWPYTLPAFRALHPGAACDPPTSFAMDLSPVSVGIDRVGDCLPHPLSLLQALVPAGEPRLEGILYREQGPDALDVSFDYVAGDARIPCEVRMRLGPEVPRRAALAISGRWAERAIAMPEYCMELRGEGRAVALPDPLTARIQAFCEELRAVVRGARPSDPAPIAVRARLLGELARAYSVQIA